MFIRQDYGGDDLGKGDWKRFVKTPREVDVRRVVGRNGRLGLFRRPLSGILRKQQSGDYLMQIKGNQKTLLEFAQRQTDPLRPLFR
jgi:hypothetical protein